MALSVARAESPAAVRGRAEWLVHRLGAVASEPVAEDAQGVVFVRAPQRRGGYGRVSTRRRRVGRMSKHGGQPATSGAQFSTPTGAGRLSTHRQGRGRRLVAPALVVRRAPVRISSRGVCPPR